MWYLTAVLVIFSIAVINIAVMVYAYRRTKGRAMTTKDQVIGFLLAGPLYYWTEKGLRKRNYRLTAFERIGLAAIALFALTVIVGGIVTGLSRY